MDSRQRERCDLMIIQPEWGTQNVNKYFYESEARRIVAPARDLAASGSRSSRQMDVQARPLCYGRCRADVPRLSYTFGERKGSF